MSHAGLRQGELNSLKAGDNKWMKAVAIWLDNIRQRSEGTQNKYSYNNPWAEVFGEAWGMNSVTSWTMQ